MSDGTEKDIKALLVQEGLTLAIAESVTGGLISNLVTDVSGCSLYYKGGVVSYSNEAKMRVLGVKKETLEAYGAVSEQTVREMAEGVRELMEADIGLADSGIAGPTGATPQKPVGLFYIGLATKEGTTVERHTFSGNRLENKRLAAEAALSMLKKYLVQTAK